MIGPTGCDTILQPHVSPTQLKRAQREKKLQKNLWKLQIAEQNYQNKQCQITKKYRSHRSGGSKNVDANSKITYL